MKNTTMKAATLAEMLSLLNRLECKLVTLDALDRDITQDGSFDLTDQVTSMTRSLSRLTDAVLRANGVNGVDAEYDNLFGETV